MQLNTYGNRVTFTSNIDLTGATAVTLTIRRPDDTEVVHPLTLPGDIVAAKSGQINYTFQQTDLNQTGWYGWQLSNVTPGQEQLSAVDVFYVRGNV